MKITRQTQLGFAWTNCPGRRPASKPTDTGCIQVCIGLYRDVARNNQGNDWWARWFVRSGRRWAPLTMRPETLALLLGLAAGEWDTLDVDVE